MVSVVVTRVTPVVSIYSPTRERPLQVIAPMDSLEWDLDRMPSDKELVKYTAAFFRRGVGASGSALLGAYGAGIFYRRLCRDA